MEYTLIDREHIYGPDHCLTLATRHHLADRAGERREPVRAAAALRQLVPDLVRIQGADHPETLRAKESLARWEQARVRGE